MALTQDTRPTTRWAATPSSRELACLSIVGAVIFFGGWQLIAMSGLVSQYVLPSPLAVLERTYQLETEPFAGFLLYQHLLSSIERFVLGFSLAAALGIPLGLIMGRYRLLDEIVAPLFEAYRYVAPLAWVPFAALWFGTGIGGPVMVIFTGAFAPCVINAYRGAQFVERYLIEAAQTLGASNLRIMREVLLPGALPSIVAGLRVSAGLGWQSLIGAELIVVSSGIGYVMVQGQSNLAPDIVMSAMLVIGVVGLFIDVALRAAERWLSRRWGRV
jgi:ABC-type nitrate/sulfonate/bicarbonate transport system permease component